MQKQTIYRPIIGLAAAAVTAVALAGCSTPAPSTLGESTTEDSTSATPGPTPSTDSYSADEAPSGSLPDWTLGAPSEGTDAFLAWEALMGPDGEYAALASYQAVLDEFGADVEPYASIKEAEARHADALTRQLERMGVTVPDNPYLGLIAPPSDLQTAAEEWAVGEVANVELYDALIDQATDSRLVRVFENLRRASADQHLPAFEQAAANGGTLDPADMMGRG